MYVKRMLDAHANIFDLIIEAMVVAHEWNPPLMINDVLFSDEEGNDPVSSVGSRAITRMTKSQCCSVIVPLRLFLSTFETLLFRL